MSEATSQRPESPSPAPSVDAELPASAPSSDAESAESAEPDTLGDGGMAVSAPSSDADIVTHISTTVHEPFEEAWRRYEEDVWLAIRRALEEAAVVHERALAAFSEDANPDAAQDHSSRGDGGEARAEEAGAAGHVADAVARRARALEQYRRTVSDDIDPLRVALARSGAATSLETSLASAADRVRALLPELPVFVEAPVSRTPPARPSGIGPIRTIKRAVARVLGPLVWRGRVRPVPVAHLARQHLDQVVLRAQASAFRESQRDRADWLGRLERAWAEWAAAVLHPPRDAAARQPGRSATQPGAHRAAGAALQAELQALIGDVGRASGRSRGADFGPVDESLAASVAVAGTFAADPPSSRPRAGRQRELARRWDAWAEGAAARLELYQSLVTMRRGTDRILRALREDWARTVRDASSVLDGVTAELSRGRERAKSLSPDEDDLPPVLEAERQRTDAVLGRLQSTLPDPESLFEALTAAVEEAIRRLDAVRERLPGTLALHDMPEPGDPRRRPATDPRTVRLRETFLHAFDLLRRERIHAAPSTIREAMHRVRAEVAELREVSGYGYEAAIAELKDHRELDAARPTVLVANGLSRAGDKAARAGNLLHQAVAAAESQVAGEIGEGTRQLIEQVTADRVTAGYLEARTYLTAGFIRAWKRWRGRLAHVGARVRGASSLVAGLLRRMVTRLGLGPAAQAAADPHEHSLAYAEEYPHTLPVVYRRLFSLEPLTDARLLAGREDALAVVAAAWARRKAGGARSLVVIAAPAVGVTSFLNVVASRLSEEAPEGVRRMFRERVRTEARLAGSLARWLGLEQTHDLDSLADQVLEARPGAIPRFAILEATEHIHMRVPGGSKLFERLLAFMSRTESRVFWIAAMTSSAWQLVEKRAPAFVHDVERVMLGELSPDQLRQAIVARHRLSGLPLRFAEPHDGRAALRRRASRLRGMDKQAQLIEADYFQRLHRASQGSIRVALFHWLRSADFAKVEGSLLVQPLSTLDPGIGNLDRTRSFALKAVLDHGTLTAEEYGEVVRAPGPEGIHILRSLEECRVIETVSDAAREEGAMKAGSGSGRGRASRYRVRPIMIGAVAAHLRSRNILH